MAGIGRPDRRGRRGGGSVLAGFGAVLAVGLAGCSSDLEGATRDLADQVESEARARVDDVVEGQLDELRTQFGGAVDVERVCALVGDERLTNPERGRLELAVELGEALGLPDDLTTAGRTVLTTSDGATTQVEELSQACARLGADVGSGG